MILPTAAYGIDGDFAEHAIALGLRFVEPLVRGALVREGGVLLEVAHHVGRLIAEDFGFDVEKPAGVAVAVIDLCDGAALFGTQAAVVELDGDVEVDADLA